jgi:hypothetical protein
LISSSFHQAFAKLHLLIINKPHQSEGLKLDFWPDQSEGTGGQVATKGSMPRNKGSGASGPSIHRRHPIYCNSAPAPERRLRKPGKYCPVILRIGRLSGVLNVSTDITPRLTTLHILPRSYAESMVCGGPERLNGSTRHLPTSARRGKSRQIAPNRGQKNKKNSR